jgi:DNA (cytosine-5)-methyltransferase 1
MTETYLSIFSGIGGLEHPHVSPLLFCEKDAACQQVLRLAHPEVPIVDDIRVLENPPAADMVVGGWPCQDISSAGTLGGIRAERSGLFFDMLRTAKAAGANTLIGENVPNLLTINEGGDFDVVLNTLSLAGYPYIGWRVLNARQFGLPQQRRRLFVVASSYRERAEAIHASIPSVGKPKSSREACAFYWTGGKRSICFCRGYAPALKIGAADNNGRAPVAVMLGKQLRKLSSRECLRLQGFDDLNDRHPDLSRSTLLRMAGNAVPRPMGRFVVDAVSKFAVSDGLREGFGVVTESGLYENGLLWSIRHGEAPLAENLYDYLDSTVEDPLSSQAAAGLIVRSVRAAQPMPLQLFELLSTLSANRGGTLRPSRANSFEILDGLTNEVAQYRSGLKPIEEYDYIIDEEDF